MSLTKVKAGNILLTTPAADSNDVTPATTAYVTTALANLADSAPSTLDTLNELAAALGDDANFSTTVTNSIAAKAPLASPTLTGNPKINVGTDKNIIFSGGIGEIGNVAGFQAINDAGSSNTDIGMRGTTIRFATGSSERMRIDSSGRALVGITGASGFGQLETTSFATEGQCILARTGGNVGIGDTSPIAKLTVKAASDTIRAESLATDAKNITMSYHDSNDQGQIFCGEDGVVDKNIVLRGHTLILQRNGGTEAMRVDSSGNILIGKTSDSQNTAGTQISSTTGVRATVDGNVAAILNRTSSDGNLVLFRQDGNTDGQINTLSGRIAIGSDDTGIFFDSTRDCISPFTMSGNDGRDGGIDIGRDAVRFKDFYLTGIIDLENAFRIRSESGQTGTLGFNRNPADGAHLGQAGFNRYQINGPFSGSDFLDFQNYNSSGTYTGGFRVVEGSIQGYPQVVSKPTYSFIGDSNTGMTRPTGDTIQFVTGGTERLRIDSAGRVGIGTNDPSSGYGGSIAAAQLVLSRGAAGANGGSSTLLIGGDNKHYSYMEGRHTSSGYTELDFGTCSTAGNPTLKMRIAANGSIGAPSGTNIYNASDERLKQNITPLTNSLNIVKALNPVRFNWIDDFEESENGKNLYGFVAQEVKEIFPDAIESFGNDVHINDEVINNPLTVREKFLIPLLTKAIQEQQTIIEDLKSRIETIEG